MSKLEVFTHDEVHTYTGVTELTEQYFGGQAFVKITTNAGASYIPVYRITSMDETKEVDE